MEIRLLCLLKIENEKERKTNEKAKKKTTTKPNSGWTREYKYNLIRRFGVHLELFAAIHSSRLLRRYYKILCTQTLSIHYKMRSR